MALDDDMFAEDDEAPDRNLFPGPVLYDVPQGQPGAARRTAAKRVPWKAPADPTSFVTVHQFYESPAYRQADFATKKKLEADYKKQFLNKPMIQAIGGNEVTLSKADQLFKEMQAKDERKTDSIFDTDLMDPIARGLARGVSGAARVTGEYFDSDLLRGLSTRAAADADRIYKENYSHTSRYKDDAARSADAKLAAEFGGKDNIPWYRTIKQEWSNFTAQPINKILESVGTSLPALAAVAVPGGVAAPLSVGLQALLTSGDAGSGAYDSIKAMPDAQLQRLPAYTALVAAGLAPSEARERLASDAALEGGAYGAVIGAVSGTVSARAGVVALLQKKWAGEALNAAEQKVVDTARQGILSRVGRPLAGEMLSEGLEEGGTAVAQNKAVQSVDPSQSLSEDALKNAAAGAFAGGGQTLIASALPDRGGQAVPGTPDPQADPSAVPPPPAAAAPGDEGQPGAGDAVPIQAASEGSTGGTLPVGSGGDVADGSAGLVDGSGDGVVPAGADPLAPDIPDPDPADQVPELAGFDPVEADLAATIQAVEDAEMLAELDAVSTKQQFWELALKLDLAKKANDPEWADFLTAAKAKAESLDFSPDAVNGYLGNFKVPGSAADLTTPAPATVELDWEPEVEAKPPANSVPVKPKDTTVYHPKLDENGNKVALTNPTKPSGSIVGSSDSTITFTPDQSLEGQNFHGVTFYKSNSWGKFKSAQDWESGTATVQGTGNDIPAGSNVRRVGVMIMEDDGRIWMVEPSNHFSGESLGLPRGQLDAGLSPKANALKEGFEETGLRLALVNDQAPITDGDGRWFFVAKREGGSPADMGWESQSVKLMPLGEAIVSVSKNSSATVLSKLAKRLADARAEAKKLKQEQLALIAAMEKTNAKAATAFRNKIYKALGITGADKLYGDLKEPLSKAAIDAINANNPFEALQDIATKGPTMYRLMAAQMMTLHNKVGVKFESATSFKTTTAGTHVPQPYAAPTSDEQVKANQDKPHGVIKLNIESGATIHTFLHEMAHAYTVYSYDNPVSAKQKVAKQELRNLFIYVREQAKLNDYFTPGHPNAEIGKYLNYALNYNAPEFIAEAFSNPILQEFMADLKMPNEVSKSLLTKLAELIAKLLGLDNAFAKTVLAIEQLVDESQNATNSSVAFSSAASLGIDPGTNVKGIKGDPDHLMVNGVKRSRKNADGKLLGKTNKEIGDFWRWFGNSQAVDDQGRPVVFYRSAHNPDIQKVMVQTSGSLMDGAYGGNKAIYFSSNLKVSKTYGPHTWPVYLRVRNAWSTDSKGAHYSSIVGPSGKQFGTDSAIQEIQIQGYDGSIVYNNRDSMGGGSIESTIATVFFPEQIRLAENIGEPIPVYTDAKFFPKEVTKREVRGYAADTVGGAASASPEAGRRNQAGQTNGRSEPDNSGVPAPDPVGSASARETGTAFGGSNPYAQSPVSDSVARAVAALPDAERVALEVAGGALNVSGADFAQRMVDTARAVGRTAVTDVFPEEDAIGRAVHKLPLPAAIETAAKAFAEQTAPVTTWDQMLELMDKGVVPTSNKFAGWTDRYIEKYIDSAQPLALMLRKAGQKIQDNPLWQLYKLAGSRFEQEKTDLNRDIKVVNKGLTRLAKSIGMDPKLFFMLVDRYTMAKYVATGANDELYNRHKAFVDETDKQITGLIEQVSKLVKGTTAAEKINNKIEQLKTSIEKSNRWILRYEQVNDQIRTPEGSVDATGAIDPNAFLKSDKFVGGMTRGEAQRVVDSEQAVQHREAFDEAQQLIIGLQKTWAKRAVESGLYNQDETDQWSSNPNYVPTTGDPDAQDPDDAVYETGGLVSRDYLRMGRNSYAHGGFMAVMQQAGGFARRLGYKDFYDALAEVGRDPANPYGLRTLPQSAPGRAGEIAIATKRLARDPEGNESTVYEKVAFADQAAAGSIIGKNREAAQKLADGPLMRGLAEFTNIFGRAVTQYTLAFGPVNYVRDLGEKAYTLLSTIPGINKRQFLSALAKEIGTYQNLRAAYAFSSNQPIDTPQYKALEQLAKNGGLNTRTGSLSKDVERIVLEMKRTDGWRAVADRVGEWVHNYNNMFEIAASLATYRALGQATDGTVEQQAFRILNTMNFGQSGTNSPLLKSLYLFFNPTAQGALNVARGVRSLKTKQGRGALIGAAIAYGFIYAFSRAFGGDDDDDEVGNRLDSLADASVARAIPLFFGDDLMVKVPVPFGIQTALWSTIVAAGRLASGRFDPLQAVMFAGQGAAEQMAPFPLSRVDITQNPKFWVAKSLTPQWGQLLLNLAADQNDFGAKLTAPFRQANQPDSFQGKRGTPEFYKDMAKSIFNATGLDMAPEQIQETIKHLALGPLGAAFEGLVKDEERSGVPTELMVAEGLTGSNRIVKLDTKEVDRSYYERMERVYRLYKKGWADVPREKENGRYESLDEWLPRTDLSEDEQQLILRFDAADKALKKARKDQAVTAEEKRIMREFLRDTRSLMP